MDADKSTKETSKEVATSSQTQAPSLRENLVTTAVEFLQEPKVAKSQDNKKRAFLKSKGMTEQEIDEAFSRAGMPPMALDPAPPVSQPPYPPVNVRAQYPQYSNPPFPPSQYPAPQYPGPPYNQLAVLPGPASQIVAEIPWRSIAIITIVCGFLGNVLARIFKKHILPFFWRKLKPRDNSTETKQNDPQEKLKAQISSLSTRVEEQSKEVKETMDLVKGFLQSNKSNMEHQKMYGQYQNQQELRQVSDLQRDIREIKAAVALKTNNASSAANTHKVVNDLSSSEPNQKNASEVEEPEKTAPHSPDFMNILEMVRKGVTPPNVRTVDDTPLEDSNQPLKDKSEGSNTKPWEQNE